MHHIQSTSYTRPLALHACCGPCALMPKDVLAAEGFEPTIFWANENIFPYTEYEKRFETLQTWAQSQGIAVVNCDERISDASFGEAWERMVTPCAHKVLQGSLQCEARCRMCYRLRLKKAAKKAAEYGFSYFGTTLAVSVYQHFDICNDELARVAYEYNMQPVIRDFRPYYYDGVTKSRELGMYRQKYCGCRFSVVEAQDGRLAARETKKARRAASEGSERKKVKQGGVR